MSALDSLRAAAAALISPPKRNRLGPPASIQPDAETFMRSAQAFSWFYEGIRQTMDRTGIPRAPLDTRDRDNAFTRREFMDISRYLYANDGLTKGAINDLARYTVGTGLRPQAQCASEEVNDQYEAYFKEWTSRADYYRKNHFHRLQWLWNTHEAVDGDLGIALVRDERGEPQVQTIRGGRIGNFGEGDELKNCKDGVVMDEDDRVVGYRIRVKDGKGRTVPYNSFILWREAEEEDGVRGLTKLAHAINHVRDKHDLLSSEKTAVKTLTQFAGVLKSATGSVNEGDWNEDNQIAEPTKVTVAQMQSGALPVIKSDEEIVPFDFNRPSPTFTGFLEFLIREIAHGMGIPFEFLWNPAALGGTAQRFILEKAQRRFNERCEAFKTQVLNRIWGYVIGDAIERGILPFDPKWNLVEWNGIAWLTVDAGRDQAQDREDVLTGMMTEATHAAMSGGDWRVRRAQVEREAEDLIIRAQRVAERTGKEFDVCLSLMRRSTANGNISQAGIEMDKKATDAAAKQKTQSKPAPAK